ncbi:MAG: hypothetical protein OCD76_01655 [Reichenbachiella sp.]
MNKFFYLGLLFFLHLGDAICQSIDLDQPIVAHFDNIRNDKAIRQVLGQYSQSYSYDAYLIQKRKVSIDSDSLSIRQLLQFLFNDSSLVISSVRNQIIIYKPVFEQSINCTGHKKVQGKVYNSVTNEPVPYAPIRYAGGTKFTVTSISGDFAMNIPCNQVEVPLEIHALGYYTKIDTIDAQSPSLVVIKPASKTLREVIIRSVTPELALRKSLNEIPENFTTERTIANSFFREIIYKDEELDAISEAILEVYKGGYGENRKAKVSLIKGRKLVSPHYNDTINFKLKGSLNSCLQLDIVSNLPRFYSLESFQSYNYAYVDLVEYGDDLVHQIDFEPKSTNQEDFYKGSLYFDEQNFSLRAASFVVYPKLMNRAAKTLVKKKSRKLKIKPKSVQYKVQYRNVSDKLYLSYVIMEIKFKIIDKRSKSNYMYTSQSELVVNHITPSNERLPNSESFLTNKVFLDQSVNYDLSFWKDIDFLPVDMKLYDAIKELE